MGLAETSGKKLSRRLATFFRRLFASLEPDQPTLPSPVIPFSVLADDLLSFAVGHSLFVSTSGFFR